MASKPEPKLTAENLTSAKVSKSTIQNGDTLSSLLQRAGFSPQNINTVLQHPILPKGFKIIAKDFYLSLNSTVFNGIKLIDPYAETTYFFWKIGEKVGSYSVQESFQRRRKSISGVIDGSVIESINKQTKSELVAYRFMDAFHLDDRPAKKLKKGAKYSLTFEQLYSSDIYIRDGEVLQASLEIDGHLSNKNYVQFEGGGIFLSPENLYRDRPLYAPVAYISVSSPFNPRRFHPIRKRRQPHWGTDFVLAPGSPVYSAQSGKVIQRGRTRAGGHYVRISHNNGFETAYNHLLAVKEGLKVGDFVNVGAVIGAVGCSGFCTKPHLHFQVKKNKKIVDPAFYIRGYPFHYEQKIRQYLSNLKSDKKNGFSLRSNSDKKSIQ